MQYEKVEKIDLDEWYDANKMKIYKNSEGFKSVIERVNNFLEEIKKNYADKNILIVTHGDVCKALYSIYNNISDAKEISLFEQSNCGIAEYDIN